MASKPERNIRVRGAVKVLAGKAGDEEIGTTRNISIGGLFVVTERRFELDRVLPLRIRYRYWDLPFCGKVVHLRPDGVGLQFVEPEPEFVVSMQAIISSLLADGSWYDERRNCLRIGISGPVVWQVGQEEIESHLRNLSIKGAFIEAWLNSGELSGTPVPPPLESEIVLFLPGMRLAAGDEALGCRARVIHRQEDGFGIEFIAPTPEFRQALEAILAAQSEAGTTD